MIYNLNTSLWMELGVRIILWILFCWLDATEPFHREILTNELWKYQYPPKPSYISAHLLWIIIFVIPVIVLTGNYVFTKSDDIFPATLGLTLAYVLNGVLTSYIKIIIGRPRPDFFFRCFPDGKADKDYMNCTGDKHSYLDGRKSFPSGHASFAFCCMTFISLYLGRKLSLFQNNQKEQSWKLCLCVLPLLIAFTIAASRTCDYHHHYEDVTFGAVLGTIISYICYKLYFSQITEPQTTS